MTSLGAVLNTATTALGEVVIEAPAAWSQGRTLYGGMTAALCHHAARPLAAKAMALRSMQVAFFRPCEGVVRFVPETLREGRATAAIAVEVHGGDGPSARASLFFGAGRDSEIAYAIGGPPDVAPAEACEPFFPPGNTPPNFMANFEMRLAAGSRVRSGGAPDFCVWVRFREPSEADPVTALLALADSLPPAAMARFARPAAISTMSWALDLTEAPANADGWHLLQSVGEQAEAGYSTQAMTLWDAHGARLCSGRQAVAIFI